MRYVLGDDAPSLATSYDYTVDQCFYVSYYLLNNPRSIKIRTVLVGVVRVRAHRKVACPLAILADEMMPDWRRRVVAGHRHRQVALASHYHVVAQLQVRATDRCNRNTPHDRPWIFLGGLQARVRDSFSPKTAFGLQYRRRGSCHTPVLAWCASGCVVECRICNREVAGSNLGLGYFAPRSTQPSIPPGLANDYSLHVRFCIRRLFLFGWTVNRIRIRIFESCSSHWVHFVRDCLIWWTQFLLLLWQDLRHWPYKQWRLSLSPDGATEPWSIFGGKRKTLE